ncbi:hypothetical protein CABS01_03329, partial [Colletotrichum abscissum]|uniref:uncharacterized protein n=1 Tax=Colletotrichum abscissum TaxID=1671311 RepID=UPI0027D6E693
HQQIHSSISSLFLSFLFARFTPSLLLLSLDVTSGRRRHMSRSYSRLAQLQIHTSHKDKEPDTFGPHGCYTRTSSLRALYTHTRTDDSTHAQPFYSVPFCPPKTQTDRLARQETDDSPCRYLKERHYHPPHAPPGKHQPSNGANDRRKSTRPLSPVAPLLPPWTNPHTLLTPLSPLKAVPPRKPA